jgi:hypothetical protein
LRPCLTKGAEIIALNEVIFCPQAVLMAEPAPE